MCYFQKVKFEMYTEQPQLRGDYWQPGETEQQYRKRQFARRQQARNRNIVSNAASRAAGRVIALRRPLKAAESHPIAYDNASNKP